MKFLTREQILQAEDLPTTEVDVPEWGGVALLRGLTGAERDRFESEILRTNKKGERETNLQNIRARMCALSIVDEDGKRAFTKSDLDALGAKSARALQRVFDAAQKLNGMSKEDAEELAGNSEATVSGDSISD